MAKPKTDPEMEAMRIAAEKREADELIAGIMSMTARIPDRIVNGASVTLVRQYKETVTKARSIANLKIRNLNRLRTAYADVRQFYS